MAKITLTPQQREEGRRIAKRSMELTKILNERKTKETTVLPTMELKNNKNPEDPK